MLEQQLDSDIHIIAYYYHWERNNILSLPSRKRKKYVELIAEQVRLENGDDDTT